MDSGNRLGDIEITDPKAMRALAHPVRLAVLERLQREGPATATQLSPHVGATPSVTSWHLRHLATFGLVGDAAEAAGDRRERRWEAVARGFRFPVEPAWRRGAKVGNTRVVVSADELAAIEDAMEAVLAPYVARDPADRPADSRGVRFLRYALPEAAADATDEHPASPGDEGVVPGASRRP